MNPLTRFGVGALLLQAGACAPHRSQYVPALSVHEMLAPPASTLEASVWRDSARFRLQMPPQQVWRWNTGRYTTSFGGDDAYEYWFEVQCDTTRDAKTGRFSFVLEAIVPRGDGHTVTGSLDQLAHALEPQMIVKDAHGYGVDAPDTLHVAEVRARTGAIEFVVHTRWALDALWRTQPDSAGLWAWMVPTNAVWQRTIPIRFYGDVKPAN